MENKKEKKRNKKKKRLSAGGRIHGLAGGTDLVTTSGCWTGGGGSGWLLLSCFGGIRPFSALERKYIPIIRNSPIMKYPTSNCHPLCSTDCFDCCSGETSLSLVLRLNWGC